MAGDGGGELAEQFGRLFGDVDIDAGRAGKEQGLTPARARKKPRRAGALPLPDDGNYLLTVMAVPSLSPSGSWFSA